jgi:hypothetical protein
MQAKRGEQVSKDGRYTERETAFHYLHSSANIARICARRRLQSQYVQEPHVTGVAKYKLINGSHSHSHPPDRVRREMRFGKCKFEFT